ncbi:FHA domain-containing protein [Candidatus Obscuribacterales bacterium]|nr:FHA domain-containing protein [Candidatus Obscuribacterales bacterium]
MAKVCSLCNKEYKGATCPVCTETGVDVKKVLESEKAQMEKNDSAPPTAFLVDLVSNRKIPITTPRCRVGRDDLNDIVISGDQSISRFHFIITYENGQYMTQDAKSRHGTFLNGNQIGGPEPINDGDVLKIGVSLFWFVIESAAGTEKEEPLPPVDVEKAAGSEDISMKTGGDYNYSAEKELSATQEISIISPEALAQYSLTKNAEDEAFEPKEPTEEVSAEAQKEEESKSESSDETKPADEAESPKAEEETAEPNKDGDAKAEAEKDKDEESPKSEDKPEEKPEEKSEEKSDEKTEDKKEEEPVAEESKPESKDSDEEKKEDKEDDKSEVVDFEPTADEDSESKKKDDIEIAVKDLLEPLQSEIEASREMVRDALRKGELKSEPDSDNKESNEAEEADEKKEEEPTSSGDDEKSEDSDKHSEDEDNKEEQPESPSKDDDDKPEETEKKDNEKSAEAETLEKIAEIIDDSSKSDLTDKRDEGPSVSADRIETELSSEHEKATNGLDEDITTVSQMGPTNVPDWCKRYFSDELKHLNKELDTLNDQIKAYQDKIRKIEGQAALTKGIRNTLLTSDGDDLIEACKKVLGLAGWKVTQSEEDKHEFLLEHEDEKVAIARVISIKGAAERSHLGQLTISQTRFWCEKGIEPKGVLIVGRVSDKSPKERGEEANEEVLEYANMKNVCIMNTLQLLALYRDIALKDGKTGELRSSIHDSKGWLKGFDIEPGDDIVDEDGEGSKSKSLSSLLSA